MPTHARIVTDGPVVLVSIKVKGTLLQETLIKLRTKGAFLESLSF